MSYPKFPNDSDLAAELRSTDRFTLADKYGVTVGFIRAQVARIGEEAHRRPWKSLPVDDAFVSELQTTQWCVLAEKYGVTTAAVYGAAKRLGVPKYTGPRRPYSTRGHKDHCRAKAVELRLEGKSYSQISRVVKASSSGVRGMCLRAGLPAGRATPNMEVAA